MSIIRPVLLLCLVCCLSGCDRDPKSARGFTLPDGDIERGKVTFQGFRCYDCHIISGVDMPSSEEPNQTLVRLGGRVAKIKTYGALVTSIINPSHKLAKGYSEPLVAAPSGESRMTNYNDAMTVSQLIDLVAFLQSHYELIEYEPTHYPIY